MARIAASQIVEALERAGFVIIVRRLSRRIARAPRARQAARRNSGRVRVCAGRAQQWASLPRSVTPATAKSVSAALSGCSNAGLWCEREKMARRFGKERREPPTAHSRAADAGEAGEADDCGEGTRGDSLGWRRRRAVGAPCRCSDRSDGIRIASRVNSIATIAIRMFGNCISKAARSKGSDVDSLR